MSDTIDSAANQTSQFSVDEIFQSEDEELTLEHDDASFVHVERGPNQGATFHLHGNEVAVGRTEDSNVFLDDVTVSRNHGLFKKVDGTWILSDLDSLNGIYVNRKLVAQITLNDGDEIQIGRYRLRFCQASS